MKKLEQKAFFAFSMAVGYFHIGRVIASALVDRAVHGELREVWEEDKKWRAKGR